MELTAQAVLLYAATFLTGAGASAAVAVVIGRYRECYLDRGRREKYEHLAEFGKKENELRAQELRAGMEDELRGREAEIAKKMLCADTLLAEAERVRAEAAAEVETLRKLEAEVGEVRHEAEAERARHRLELLRLADISVAEARKAALELVRQECEAELARQRQEILGPREEDIRGEARRIIIDTMQRLAPEVSQEANTSVIPIPNEEMKGRLIGREGRNIKTFEQYTGVTLLIDETPETVLVSSFDPVRREVARLALDLLIRDGRIHPDNIEKFVEKAREQVIGNAADFGREAVDDLGLPQPDLEIVELLGRLHFRLSANQNTLAHSVEVARFAALIASELGIDPLPAKRAGLLHDIGKAIDAECEGSHAQAGARLLRRLGESPAIVNAVAAHHGEEPPTSIYAPIIVLADKISASRPGARSANLEGYFCRMRNLETIAKSFPGITEAYAVMSGREMRVSVAPEKMTEAEAREVARKIRVRIEEELQYPGTIHITLIREQRFHEEAR